MILGGVIDFYENDPEKRRKPASGNPTGSAMGKCAAQLQLHRYPEVGQPEPLRTRAKLLFEVGDMVEDAVRSAVQKAYPGLVGGVQGLGYFPVLVSAEQARELRGHMARGRNDDPDRLWGTVRFKYDSPKPRVEGGRLIWRMMRESVKDPGPGFILDPVRRVLWCPLFIDFTVYLEDLGHCVAEVKSVSNAVFRRLQMGDLDYQKRCQAAAIVEATGLPFVLIAFRKETGHMLEVSYLPTRDGTIRVRIMKLNRQVEEFRVDPKSEEVTTPDGAPAKMTSDDEWEIGSVWTPHDPAILDEIQQRVRDVVFWRPDNPLRREYGPTFNCKKCRGDGVVVCHQCKGTGETPKTRKPCGPCGGARMEQCPECEGQKILSEARLPWQCSYCPVKGACYGESLAATGVPEALRMEIENNRPRWLVKRSAWLDSGLTFKTPATIRPLEVVATGDDIPAIS